LSSSFFFSLPCFFFYWLASIHFSMSLFLCCRSIVYHTSPSLSIAFTLILLFLSFNTVHLYWRLLFILFLYLVISYMVELWCRIQKRGR